MEEFVDVKDDAEGIDLNPDSGSEQSFRSFKDSQVAEGDGIVGSAPCNGKEPEDEVVKTLKIVLLPDTSKKLYLMEFQTNRRRHKLRVRPKSGRIKPVADIFEFEQEFPEEIFSRAGLYNHTTDNSHQESSNMRPKLVSHKVSPCSQYTIAKVKGDFIYLTPVSSIQQFRSDISYLDRLEEQANERNLQLETLDRDDSDYEDQSKIVSVVVQSNDEMQNKLINISNMIQAVDSEKWVQLNIKVDGLNPQEAEEILCPSTEFNCDYNIKFLDRIFEILGTKETDIPSQKKLNTKLRTPLHVLKTYPLDERVLAFMKNVIITDFSTLTNSIEIFNEHEVLKVLSKVAVLIRGVWILRSEFMYRGIAIHLRAYILFLFSMKTHVKRSELNFAFKFPFEMINNIFYEIAVYAPNLGWHLKYPDDVNFCKKYPQLFSLHVKTVKENGQKAMVEILKLTSDK